MKCLFVSVLLLMISLAEMSVYAEEKAPLEDLLTNVIEDITPALDVMRRHKVSLEEKMGGGDSSREGEATTGVRPSPSKFDSDRDPFATSPLIERKGTQPGGPDFRPLAANLKTPELKLRGIVSGAGGDRVALLDIFGSDVYLVREGDTISLHGSGRNTVIKVQEVSYLSLTVAVGTLGEVLIVR